METGRSGSRDYRHTTDSDIDAIAYHPPDTVTSVFYFTHAQSYIIFDRFPEDSANPPGFTSEDSLCVFSSACSALKFSHIESVLVLFHTLTILFFQTQDGVSPVYVASQNGHTEVVDLLVQEGADINLATADKVHVSTHSVLFSSSSCGD